MCSVEFCFVYDGSVYVVSFHEVGEFLFSGVNAIYV